MKLLQHIYDDEQGMTHFDKYFRYLDGIKHMLPNPLAEFALDPGRYELRGSRTIHDAWLISMLHDNAYKNGKTANSEVRLRLLLSDHASAIDLIYGDVTNLKFELGISRQSKRPLDLIVHEFQVIDPSTFSHVFSFEGDSFIRLEFSSFACRDIVETPRLPQ